MQTLKVYQQTNWLSCAKTFFKGKYFRQLTVLILKCSWLWISIRSNSRISLLNIQFHNNIPCKSLKKKYYVDKDTILIGVAYIQTIGEFPYWKYFIYCELNAKHCISRFAVIWTALFHTKGFAGEENLIC